MLVLSMDPNNQNPQGDGGALNKLEQDLKNLNEQVASTSQQPEPVAVPTIPIEQAIPTTPPILNIPNTIDQPPVMPPPVTVPAEPIATAPSTEGIPKKGSPLMVIAIILAVVAVLAVVGYVFGAKLLTPKTTQVACTMEAKICPDGSSVGRIAPNCEFAACPVAVVTPDPTANWKTHTDIKFGFSFKYPENIVTQSTDIGAKISGLNEEISVISEPTISHNFYVDKKLTNKYSFNEINWNYLTGDSQVCDGGMCDKVSDALQTVNGKSRYTIVLGGLVYPDKVLDQILSTFKFIEATPSASPIASPSSSPSAAVTP
jgi:hypothetical protein